MLDDNRFLIWFEGWGDEWMMWLDRRYDLARIRPCQPEVGGLGKRGPLQRQQLIDRQRLAITRILAKRLDPDADSIFPDGAVWKIPQTSPAQGVLPSPYCRGWESNRRAFTAEWRDMEQPDLLVTGGRKAEDTAPFEASLPPAVDAESWAHSQARYLQAGHWVDCNGWSAAATANDGPFPLPVSLRHNLSASTSDEPQTQVRKPWYRVHLESLPYVELHATWRPDSAVVGVLDDRAIVQIESIVTGSKHFPPELGRLDLRAMARCVVFPDGWVEGDSDDEDDYDSDDGIEQDARQHVVGWFMVRNKNGMNHTRAVAAPSWADKAEAAAAEALALADAAVEPDSEAAS